MVIESFPTLCLNIFHTYCQYSQMRAGFDLENVQFSDGSDQELQLPAKEKLDMYNQEYSLLLTQAKQFFADCKGCISRLMALNSMDFGFNLPFILTTVLSIENKWINKKNTDPQQQASNTLKKEKYFKSFYNILHRMGDIVGDLLDLEVDIKKNYMGIHVQKPERRLKKQFSFHQKASLRSGESGGSNDLFKKQIKHSLMVQEEERDNQNQEKIRGILKKHMVGSKATPNSVCKIKGEPMENLERLSSKMDLLKLKIKTERQKEQKIWQNFNKRKPSNQTTVQEKQKEKKRIKFNEMRILDDTVSIQSEQSFSIKTKNTIEREQSTIFCT